MRVTRFGVVAAVVAGLGAAAPARADDGGLKIQVVKGLFADVPPGMVKILGGPLKDLIGSKTGLGGDIELAPDAATLADRMKDNQCQLGVFHGFEFAWAKARNPNLVPLVVTVPPTGKVGAVIVVHKDSKAATVADLDDSCVTVPRGTKGHCWAFLAKQRGGLADTCAAPKAAKDLTAETALDGVVSGTLPAALVDASAYIGYQKIHPGAVKHLRVLAESEAFPQNVIAYSKGALTPAQAAALRDVLTSAHTAPGGKPLMMLWNIKGFSDIPANYDKQLEASAKSYPAPTEPTGKPHAGGQ